MLTLYFACLIFGGILLTISLFSGSSEANTDVDQDFSSDHSLGEAHLDSNVELHNGELSHHGEISENNSVITDAVKFLSFRNVIFFLTFFGLTGSVLQFFLDMGGFFVFILSVLMGGFSAGLGYKFMKYLKDSETGTDSSINRLEGHVGKVVLPLSKSKHGKLIIESQGQYFEIQALVSDNSEEETLNKGDEVLILEILNNVAYVIKNDL